MATKTTETAEITKTSTGHLLCPTSAVPFINSLDIDMATQTYFYITNVLVTGRQLSKKKLKAEHGDRWLKEVYSVLLQHNIKAFLNKVLAA